MQKIMLLILAIALSGCFFRPHEVVRLPGAPVMIGEVRSHYAEAFSYSPETGTMISLGWIDLKEYQSWTFSQFDWATYIEERNK